MACVRGPVPTPGAGLVLAAILLAALISPCQSARELRASDRCAELTRRGQTLKPRGGSGGWSLKFGDLDECLRECTNGYKYVVENQATGTCYCWRADSDYRWSDDANDDQVYDVSDCQETTGDDSSSSSRDDDDSPGSTRGGGLDDCVNVRSGYTIKPQAGERGWAAKHDNLDTCLRRCQREDGYMYIVENSRSGDCYCYHSESRYRWENEDIGSDVLYDISMCFQLPKLTCPDDDQPGWIDQPKNMRCKKSRYDYFIMEEGYRYTDWDGKRKEYDGTMRHCKSICNGIIVGDLPDIPANCWTIEFDEDDGDCIMFGGCSELEPHRDSQVSVYCGLT